MRRTQARATHLYGTCLQYSSQYLPYLRAHLWRDCGQLQTECESTCNTLLIVAVAAVQEHDRVEEGVPVRNDAVGTSRQAPDPGLDVVRRVVCAMSAQATRDEDTADVLGLRRTAHQPSRRSLPCGVSMTLGFSIYLPGTAGNALRGMSVPVCCALKTLFWPIATSKLCTTSATSLEAGREHAHAVGDGQGHKEANHDGRRIAVRGWIMRGDVDGRVGVREGHASKVPVRQQPAELFDASMWALRQ